MHSKLTKVEKSFSEMGLKPKKFNNEYKNSENCVKNLPRKYVKNVVRMLKNLENTDVKVIIGDVYFNCHILVLKSYSKYFKNMEETSAIFQDTIELAEEQVTSCAFQTIYNWMLDDEGTIHRSNIAEVLKAALFLEVEQMLRQIWCCIDNHDFFNEKSAFSLYMEAKQTNFPLLQTLMLNRISKVFLTIVASREFVELTSREVHELLQSSRIAINSELDVLHSAIRWLQYDWDSRKDQTLPLLQTVRFGLISSWQIVEYKNTPDQLKHIFEQEEVVDYLNESLAYISMKMYKVPETEGLAENQMEVKDTIKFKYFNVKKQIPRIIIHDPFWEQFDFEKNFNVFQNFCNFKRYLQLIQKNGNNFWENLKSTT